MLFYETIEQKINAKNSVLNRFHNNIRLFKKTSKKTWLCVEKKIQFVICKNNLLNYFLNWDSNT